MRFLIICFKLKLSLLFNIYLFLTADCKAPPQIPRAMIQDGPTTEGAVRFYVCDKNTQKEGIAETKCQSDGTWTPISLYCRRKFVITLFLYIYILNYLSYFSILKKAISIDSFLQCWVDFCSGLWNAPTPTQQFHSSPRTNYGGIRNCVRLYRKSRQQGGSVHLLQRKRTVDNTNIVLHTYVVYKLITL